MDSAWPVVDPQALVKDRIEMVVQVKGKMRGRITVAADADEDTIRDAALAEANVRKHIEGNQLRKVIVVPGRLVNLVVS